MRVLESIPAPQPVRLRRSRIVLLVLLALVVAAGVMVLAASGEQRRMRRELSCQVCIAAPGIDPGNLARLSGTAADEHTPAYLRLKSYLAATREMIPSCRFVYLLGRRPDGAVFFYADSEPPTSPDYSPAGQLYEEVNPQIWRIFDNRQPLVAGPARDRWGTWVSALTPLPLPGSGGRVAVLGMDVRANEWQRVLLWRLWPSLGAALIAIALMSYLCLLGLRLRAEKGRLASHATALRESETLFRGIAEQLRDAIFLTDLDGCLTYVSPAVETVTGYPAQMLRNQPLETLFGGDQGTQEVLLRAMSAGDEVAPREQLLLRPDGEQCHLEVSASPLRHAGLVVGMIGLIRDITERWHEAERIALSESKFAATFQYSPVAAAIVEEEGGEVLDVNPAFEALTGYSRAAGGEHLRGLELICDETDRAGAHEQLLASGEIRQTPTRVRTAAGEVRQVLFSAARLLVGEKECLLIRMQDLTELRAAEASLRQRETYLRSLFRVAPIGLAVGLNSVHHEANAAWCAITGYSQEELIGVSADVFYAAPEEAASTADAIATQVREQGAARVETRWRRRDGQMVDVLICATRTDPEGDSESLTYAAVDITDRRRAEAALRESESFLRSLFRVAPIGLAVGTERCFTEANDAFCTITGYGCEEILGSSARLFFASDADYEAAKAEMVRELTAHGACQVEMRWQHKDGREIDVLLHATWTYPEGNAQHLTYAVVDITDRRRAENALQESRRIAWTLLDATQDQALLLDPMGGVLGVNAGVVAALQRPAASLIGRSLADLLPPSRASRRLTQIARAREQGTPLVENEELEGRALSVAVHPVVDEAGTVSALALFVRDITELRRAEDAQRFASLGQLAAGVAHEFNNLLCAIAMHASLAHQVRSAETLDNAYHNIREAATRGSAICDSLLGFARPLEPVYSVVSATAPLEAALALSKPQLTSGQVTVQREYDPQTPPLWADASQLEQVYLNLIVNACHAMPQGGKLLVRVRPDADDPQGRVLVEVTDSGHGIAPEHLPHLFDPFFTTKGALGQSHIAGTGLGLSVSRGIVLAHGGAIRALNAPGGGATLELRLPACPPECLPEALPESGEAAEETAAAEAVAGLRLLLAEDEPSIREVTAEFMTAVGVSVTVSGDADEAISLLRQRPFDLVVTDLMMPGGGLSVVRTVASMSEAPALLVITGRLNSQLERELLAAGANGVLAKPFGPDELLQALQRLCRPQRPAAEGPLV